MPRNGGGEERKVIVLGRVRHRGRGKRQAGRQAGGEHIAQSHTHSYARRACESGKGRVRACCRSVAGRRAGLSEGGAASGSRGAVAAAAAAARVVNERQLVGTLAT